MRIWSNYVFLMRTIQKEITLAVEEKELEGLEE